MRHFLVIVMCCVQYSRSHLLNVEEFRAVVDTLRAWKVRDSTQLHTVHFAEVNFAHEC